MRIVAIAIISAVIGICVPSVGASTPVPASTVGVSSGKAFRAGWYEDVTGDCNNIKDAAAGLFGSVTGGSGQISYLPGVGLLGATSAPSATGFGATFLAGIGAGGAAVTAAQAAAVAAVGVTGFCAGLLGAQWITGNAPYVPLVYNGPFFSFNDNIIPCAQITGFNSAWEDGGSMCQRFSPQTANYAELLPLNQFGEKTFGTNTANGSGPWRCFVRGYYGQPGGPWEFKVGDCNESEVYVSGEDRGKQVIWELNCRSATLCAGVPNSSDGGSLNASIREINEPRQTAPLTGGFLNSGSIPVRLQARSYCQSPVGQTQLFSGNGAWSEAGNTTAPAINGELCPAGWLKLTYNLDISTMPSSARSACLPAECVDLANIPTSPGASLVSWVIPTYVQTNPVLRQCYLDGFTNCEATTTGGVTTVNNTVTNQTTNVTVGGAQTTVTEVLEPIRDAIATVPSPTTVPNTSPTTTAVASTTTTSIPTTTTTIVVSGPGDPIPPPPVVDGDGGWGSCMDDQTANATSDNGWSLAAVGKYIVKWMVAPIICAAYWLVVPPDGWSAEWDLLSSTLWTLPLFVTFTEYADVIDISVSNCVPVGFHPVIMGHDYGANLDLGLCGDTLVNGIFLFLIGLGVLGVLYSGLKSITSMSNKSSEESDSS